MTEEEKKEIIKRTLKLMIQFHLDHKYLKIDCVNDEFVNKWFEKNIEQDKLKGLVK